MGLQRFERRLERLVEGAFGKAFRSGLQPVEIGRRIVREMDAGPHARRARHGRARTSSSCRCRTKTSSASPVSTTRWSSELADAAREHAREDELPLRGPGRGHDRRRRAAPGGATSRSRPTIVAGADGPAGHARRCPTAAGSRSATHPRSSAACPTARCRSPIRRSRATTPRCAAASAASASSTSTRRTARCVNGVRVQRAAAHRRRRDHGRRNVDPLRGVVAGTCPTRSSPS